MKIRPIWVSRIVVYLRQIYKQTIKAYLFHCFSYKDLNYYYESGMQLCLESFKRKIIYFQVFADQQTLYKRDGSVFSQSGYYLKSKDGDDFINIIDHASGWVHLNPYYIPIPHPIYSRGHENRFRSLTKHLLSMKYTNSSLKIT